MSTPYDAGSQPTDTTYCNFTVGQHVVCIDDDWQKTVSRRFYFQKVGTVVTKGVVYAVEAVTLSPKMGRPHIRLVEVNLVGRDGKLWFCARRFRPLQKLKIEDFLAAETPVDSVPA